MSIFYGLSVYDLDLYHIVSVFFIYSILGWIVESIYMSVCNRKLTNRGFIKGPICPIYGGSAVIIYFVLLPLSGHYVAIYFAGVVLATAIEYAIARIMQYAFGEVWWDYNEKPFNYKGIICLESSVVWGFYCVMLFAFLQKGALAFVDFYTGKIGIRAGQMIVSLLVIYYIASFARAVSSRQRKDGVPLSIEEEDMSAEAGEAPVTGENRIMRALRGIRK